jgi:hypothetical protein
VRSLYTADEFLQLGRKLQGFGPKMEDKRLAVTPRGGPWKSGASPDPWLSREHATSADAVDPLLLYALHPALFRTETGLEVAREDETAWTLECRRPGDYGSVRKRITVRKRDLALSRLEIEELRGTNLYRYEFEATAFGPAGELTIALGVSARYHGFPKVVRWTRRADPGAPEPPVRSRKDLGEEIYSTPGLGDRREVELRRILDPRDRQALADLAWATFPRSPGWHYRYFEEGENDRRMLRELREADPKSPAAREEWLRRTRRGDDPDEARMLAEAPAPLYNHAARLFEGGKTVEAEAVARAGLRNAETAGDRLNWTCLLAAILSREGKGPEATALWLEAASALDDGEPATQAFLAEVAVGRGLAAGFEAAKAGGPAAAFLLLVRGEGEAFGEAVRATSGHPAHRRLMSELVFGRASAHDAAEKHLAGIPDVDALLAAASLRKAAGGKTDDLVEAALALWEKEATCRLWTWDVWGRATLRMLRRLQALGQGEAAVRLASRFVERCAEGKVSMWLGVYRWGETVGECLVPLMSEGKTARFVELLALSSDLAGRVGFSRREGFVPPLREMVEHLAKSRDPEEARGWARMAGYLKVKGEDLRPLLTLAREVAPGDLAVENAHLEATGRELPIEQAEDLLRRTLAAMKAGTYRDRTGGNSGMTYERLARLQVEAGKLEAAVATAREMVRESDLVDSMSVINLGYAVGNAGRRDLEKELYVVAARSNAHLRPFSAQTLVERLEPLGEHAEIYALSIRTRETWRDGIGRREGLDRGHLEKVREAGERAAARVRWEDVFKPWLDRPRPELTPERTAIAAQAIEDLQADLPAQRDRAQRILSLMGERLVPLLRKPALEGEPEERGRARAILQRIYAEEWK